MLKLSPQKITLLLSLTALALLTLNCTVLVVKGMGFELWGMVRLFDLDEEKNLPTFFSTALAIIASGLLLAITLIRRQMERSWKLWASLSALFLLVAMDEFIGVHEQLSAPLRDLLDAKGLLYFAWVIPYAFLVMLLAGIYGRFVFDMPAHIRNGILLSATLFLVGALGFDMLSGMLFEYSHLTKTMLYGGVATMKETCEMAGMILFIHTLMRHIEDVQKNILLQLGTYDPMERIVKDAQKPLPQSLFRMGNRAEP
ncbi:MAG TPA: hypothetical protein VD810_05365 [Methylophilaceae bacterium]|nr:hypothetical protein [Methylophilaceae bacterium]